MRPPVRTARCDSIARTELDQIAGIRLGILSALVNELHKPLVPARGLFASGKFDQYKRDIPYATLAQAFQSLIRPLLGRNEAELSQWRSAIREAEALDPNGQLMVDLVPELKLIIGEQSPVPELPLQEAQNRFQYSVDLSAYSRGRNIRLRSSLMTCNGWTLRHSI